ncbi:MAG: hypothetical protein WD738_01665 [Pirellulales bacterium]
MQSIGDSTNDLTTCARTVEQGAQELLSQHSHFRDRAGDFKYEYSAGVLIVRGCVPTFYLKQVLQTVLKEVEGVAWIDNQVNVISGEGMSGVRPRSCQSTD